MDSEETVATAMENNSIAETDVSVSQSLSPTPSEEEGPAQGEEHRQKGAEPTVSGGRGGDGGQEAAETAPEGERAGHGDAEEDRLEDTPPETGARMEKEEEDEEQKGEEEAGEADKENAAEECSGGFHDDAAGERRKPQRDAQSPGLCSESDERDRMRQKQRQAEAELQELRKRREERRKVLEEVEKRRKREMELKKAREEEEKRQMKEGIERRRAEAAEKRRRTDAESATPFVCIAPRGSALKIGDRADVLNKSVQKSSALRTSHVAVISKIDDRIEQYTTALQSCRDAPPPRPALDLPVVTDGIRSLKTRWEEGGTFGNSNINKESAHVNVAVAGLISDWLRRTPEAPRSAGGTPSDLKHGDVTNKRSLWESRCCQTPAGDVSKALANGKPLI